MTSSWQNDLTHQQLQTLGNSEQTIVLPIDWQTILETGRDPPKTPHAVREYLANVVHKLNFHFGVIMTGPDIGKIQVNRKSIERQQVALQSMQMFLARNESRVL